LLLEQSDLGYSERYQCSAIDFLAGADPRGASARSVECAAAVEADPPAVVREAGSVEWATQSDALEVDSDHGSCHGHDQAAAMRGHLAAGEGVAARGTVAHDQAYHGPA